MITDKIGFAKLRSYLLSAFDDVTILVDTRIPEASHLRKYGITGHPEVRFVMNDVSLRNIRSEDKGIRFDTCFSGKVNLDVFIPYGAIVEMMGSSFIDPFVEQRKTVKHLTVIK